MPTSRLLHRAFLRDATLLCFAAILAWDASGLDLWLAQQMGSSQGFPLREDGLLTRVLHDGAKQFAWLVVLGLCATAARAWGPFRRVPFRRRLQMPVGILLSMAAVSLLKAASHTSCPWDLAAFGGVARHVSHWSGWFVRDGGGGHCFPAGHASVGYAFVAGYFALRHDAPRFARIWLATALGAGLVLGGVQQLRGAHFMSHTLWTGWICWVVAWAVDVVWTRATAPARPEPTPAPALAPARGAEVPR